MADAVKTCWQDMEEEAADELVCRECHERVALGTLDPVVFVFERDAHRVSCDQGGDWRWRRDACSARGTREPLRVRRMASSNRPPIPIAGAGRGRGERVGISERCVRAEEV